MRPAQPRSRLYKKLGHIKSAIDVPPAVLSEIPAIDGTASKLPAGGASYWKERLILRRYRFPASDESEDDLTAYVSDGERGYFFPLGTPDVEAAAANACQIYKVVAEQGWDSACREFTRELIVSFEWCLNPVLWTYTTIHTLVGKRAELNSAPSRDQVNQQRVLVLDLDDGIRRALCWSIEHQAGFVSVPCSSVEFFNRALVLHKPRMVMLNRNLAGPVGFKSAGTIAPVQPGVPAITYSVHQDGDHMFVSTPGGAAGYLVKRVPPDRLLDPVLKAINRPEMTADDFLLRIKYYFQELLQLPSSHDNSGLAKLTPREREVLELLSKGYVDKEIAQAMGIGIWTVHDHVKNIFERLKVRTRTEAAIRYLEK